jgi:hypothetical protein
MSEATLLSKIRPPEKCGPSGASPSDPAKSAKRRLARATDLLFDGVVPKTKPACCEDCYFHQNMLCALNLGKPCTTFRSAERGLEPERQLAFVFRTERTTATYAFPQPRV